MTIDSALPATAGLGVCGTEQKRDLTLRQLIDAFMAADTGRDNSRHIYVRARADLLGDRPVSQLDADTVADTFELLARTPARRYVGRDEATGQPIHEDLGLRKPASLNRYKSALSAVLTWAQAPPAAGPAAGSTRAVKSRRCPRKTRVCASSRRPSARACWR
jgi:hypothetical protein